MSNIDDNQKNELLNKIKRIELSDTISQFMEKCNDNFFVISDNGGGPAGVEGEKGSQGVPTKPKVPIHVWKKGNEYSIETESKELVYELECNPYELYKYKYQEGHLILLENAHVYRLEVDENNNLTPKFLLQMNTFDPDSVIDGKSAYIHIAFADSSDGNTGFRLSENLSEDENKKYMGIYSDNVEASSNKPTSYTWLKIIGEKGEKGDTPTSTSVEAIGYSLKDLDLKSGEWKSSISELGTLKPGLIIYIKNKYTWGDNSVSYGKTVTMTGTQGVKGDKGDIGPKGDDGNSIKILGSKNNESELPMSDNKIGDSYLIDGHLWVWSDKNWIEVGEIKGPKGDDGRVLFYLGSFKDGTLTEDTVTGYLDKYRCDYYIDTNDVAWMRTGEAKSAIGQQDGSMNNNSEWIKTEKIGLLNDGSISGEMINKNSFSKEIFNAVNATKINAEQIQLRYFDDTTEEYIVNAGLSGTKDDNILLWGGGTYSEAVSAAADDNDYYKQPDKGNEQITTLIKKDGQGKIGIFKISDTQAVVDVPNQGKVIIDTSESDGGIRLFNNDGALVSGIILGSISGYSSAPLEDSKTTEDINVEYSRINFTIRNQYENSINIVKESGDIPKAGVIEEYEGNYKKTTTTKVFKSKSLNVKPIYIDGEIDVNVESGRTPYGTINISFKDSNGTEDTEPSPYILQFNSVDGDYYHYKAVIPDSELFSDGSYKEYEGTITVYITLNLEGTDVVINSSSLRLSQTDINSETYTVTSETTYEYNPCTLVGKDGFVSILDNNKYFIIDNSGKDQKILASGLPTYEANTNPSNIKNLEKGQLYVLGGELRIQQ